jgi:3-hydroxyisobutyrate dehydrogenase
MDEEVEQMQVGFVGLGAMGRPMAACLADRFPTRVWNRTSAVAEAHADAHGTIAVADLVELGDVDVLCTCLPTTREVAAVARELGPALRPGTIWLDHTSGDPAGTRDVALELGARDVDYLDAPVSGGTDGAASGSLTVMVGGDLEVLDEVRPVLDAMAARVVHVGPTGAGMAVKAVNNTLLATSLWAAAEGLTVLQRLGVDPAAAIEVINASSGRSFATERLVPERVLTREFPATFALQLLAKDVGLAEAAVEEVGVDAPLVALVAELTRAAVDELGGEVDHSALVRVAERRAGVELGSA